MNIDPKEIIKLRIMNDFGGYNKYAQKLGRTYPYAHSVTDKFDALNKMLEPLGLELTVKKVEEFKHLTIE